jgi:ParB family chromosome partitioning protein
MKRLPQYDVFEIPVDDIYFDAEFNCRGSFTLQSVQDLADSIEKHGLQFPIVVQPYAQDGFAYRLLAGHRRFRATTTYLKWTQIPACIRYDLTEHQSRILNLTENLERKDLNILEEAKALGNLYPDGVSLRVAAAEIKRPTRWVHVRLRLLEMPDEVQQWAAAGFLSAVNLDALAQLETDEQKIEAAVSIRMQKQKKSEQTQQHRKYTVGRKTKQQISEMIAHLFAVSFDGLPCRLLAWAAGRVSDEEIERDIQNAQGYEHPIGYQSPYR